VQTFRRQRRDPDSSQRETVENAGIVGRAHDLPPY
jgi:ribosome modulation factor